MSEALIHVLDLATASANGNSCPLHPARCKKKDVNMEGWVLLASVMPDYCFLYNPLNVRLPLKQI